MCPAEPEAASRDAGPPRITCFRYLPEGASSVDDLNEANRSILERLVREGHVYMSPTVLEGRYALRVCIVNFRTDATDIDFLVDEVLRLGSAIDH